MRIQRIIKALLVFLIALNGFLFLTFLLINLPLSHRFVTQKVNSIFNSSGLPVHIESFTKVFPWSVHAQGILISDSKGDTIVYAGKVRSGLKPLALFRHKVVLSSVSLEGTKVEFLRNPGEEQLNIAEAFSHGNDTLPLTTEEIGKPWDFSISDAEVNELCFHMTDSIAGIYLSQDVNSLRFVTRVMSYTEKTLILKSLYIVGATGTLTLDTKSQEENSDSGSPWNFGLEELNAENLNFVYNDRSGKMMLDLLAGKVEMKAGDIDFNKKNIDFDRISVSGTSIVLGMDNQPDKNVKKDTTAFDKFPWKVNGNLIDLHDVACRIANYTGGSGYNPLSQFSVMGLDMRISDLQLNQEIVNAELENLKFDLANGFSLRELKGRIDSHSGTSRLDLNIETSSSRINLVGKVDGNIFNVIQNPSSIHKASLTLEESSFSLSDLFLFEPELEKISGINSLTSMPLNVKGEILLENSVLSLPAFLVSQYKNIGLSLTGRINNVFELKNAVCDLKLESIEINYIWLKKLMENVIPEYSLPEFKLLSLEGSVSDSLLSPNFSLRVKSDLGKIDLAGSLNLNKDNFSVKSHFDNILLGRILDNQIIGTLTGSVDIEGGGITQKSLNATAIVSIDTLGFMDYDYGNARILCTLRPGKYDMQLDINDPSLTLTLTAGADISGHKISGRVGGNFLANLYNLHFYNDTIIVEGRVASDFIKNRENIEGGVLLSGIKFTTPENSAIINSITGSLKSDSLSSTISYSSDFFTGEGHIQKSLGSIGSFLKSYLNYLVTLVNPVKADSLKIIPLLPAMSGNIDIEYNNAFKVFVPDRTLFFRKLSLSVRSDAGDNTINYTAKGRGIQYKSFKAGNINASLSDSSSILNLNFSADTLIIGQQQLNRLEIRSNFSDWKSLTSLSVIDRQLKQNYQVEISSETDSTDLILKIPSGKLTLNGAVWWMDTPQILTINLKTRDFIPTIRMHSDSADISFLQDAQDGWKRHKLELKNVSLSSFLKPELLPGNPGLTISGSATYSSNKSLGDKLATNLSIRDITWYDLTYRKIKINSNFLSDTTGKFDFDINTRLDTSEIIIRGNKKDKDNGNISARFNLIPVNTIQPFVVQYLSDLKGNVSGEFNLSTINGKNNFTGDLFIKKVNLKINTLNSSFRLPDERIEIADKRLFFNNFRILDSLNNELLVEGNVDFRNTAQLLADLEISSSNLQILNRKMDRNSTFYGDVFIDSKLTIKGPVMSPVLKGRILLAKGTDIYFRQTENLSLSESSSVVTFVSNNPSEMRSDEKKESVQGLYNKTSVESVVVIDPTTRINLELSKKMFNIDMTIKGGGELTYNMLVNSQVHLNGKYEIGEGAANLKIVGWPNKAFKLTKGGFIRWDGKMDDPDLKLEAVSTVKSSYVNPVDNKERYVDFDVTLKISNRLSVMDVLFTINTPDQYLMSIINTMSPEEQMRQAITILLFEYIDLPGISTSSNYVSEQVNQMVASQLNQLTKTTIKGVDISFGINTYTQGTTSGGQQTKTSLSYEIKRNLLNDRAKVEFSGIVSDAGSQSHSSNTSLNNFTFEYRLDSAATKFLKVYNEHTYEDVFEGDVVKTGIGFTYRRSYPSLGDIWKRDDKIIKPNNTGK